MPTNLNARFQRAAVFVLAVSALGASVATFNRGVRSRPAPTAPDDSSVSWHQFATSGQRFGPTGASLDVLVFSDYQCGACRSFYQRMKRLIDRRKLSIEVVVRHFPLAGHPYARPAARTAICGDSFDNFPIIHELMLTNADSLTRIPWARYAAMAGVADTTAFGDCIRSTGPDSIIDVDIRAGHSLGVIGTPTFFIGSEMYSGVPWDLEDIVARHLAAKGQ